MNQRLSHMAVDRDITLSMIMTLVTRLCNTRNVSCLVSHKWCHSTNAKTHFQIRTQKRENVLKYMHRPREGSWSAPTLKRFKAIAMKASSCTHRPWVAWAFSFGLDFLVCAGCAVTSTLASFASSALQSSVNPDGEAAICANAFEDGSETVKLPWTWRQKKPDVVLTVCVVQRRRVVLFRVKTYSFACRDAVCVSVWR